MALDPRDFIIEVRNSSLARLGQLKASDLSDAVIVPRATEVGSWSLSLPAYEVSVTGSKVEHELCKALRQPGAGIVVTGPGGVVLSGPMQEATSEITTEDPDGIWHFTGISDMHVLADALAWGDPTTYDLAAQKASNDTLYGAAETLIYSYISRNIGPAAVTERKNTRITLATDIGRGVVQQKSPRFQNLLELVKELVAGTTLNVDVVQVGSNLEVRVTERSDLSGKIRLDIANDQLTSLNFTMSAPGATHAIVAGSGEGIARKLIMRTTTDSLAAATAFGRRIERFVDQRQTDNTTELQGAGDDALSADGKTQTAFEITPNSALNLVYGVDWSVGAKITVIIQGQETTAYVAEAPISISSEGVFIGAVVGDPSGFSWESTVNAKQGDLEVRLSQLETNAESIDTALVSPVNGQPLIFNSTTGKFTNGTLPVTGGGTGAATLGAGQYLKGNGTGAILSQSGIPIGDVSGTLPIAQGGTGSANGAGLVPMIPTSVGKGGGTAYVATTYGRVYFSGVTYVRLTGVFVDGITSYLVVFNNIGGSTGITGLNAQFSAGGVDNGSNYYRAGQWYRSNGTSGIESDNNVGSWRFGYISGSYGGGGYMHIQQPKWSAPTMAQGQFIAHDQTGPFIALHMTVDHYQTYSADGLTIFPSAGNFSGYIQVFGFRE